MTRLEIMRLCLLEDFARTTLREHWANGGDSAKLIGLAEEMGLDDLVKEFKQQLKDDAETQADIRAYHSPYLKTIFNH
jgi:hypothetical protein